MGEPASRDPFEPAEMTDRDFQKLGNFIHTGYGIKMPPVKKVFLQNRLHRRVKLNGFSNFREYIDFVFTPTGKDKELPFLVDAVSTHKTDFFREPHQFEYLFRQSLNELLKSPVKRNVNVWSAGCSTGEEPYTIAMVLQEMHHARKSPDFSVIATDISEPVLRHANSALYDNAALQQIPTYYQVKYLQKEKSTGSDQFSLVPEIRKKVAFRNFNLLDKNYDRLGKFEIIFCRNVLIYFEREVQYNILSQLCRVLEPDGYLFLGHSETIFGIDLPLRQISPTIYRKKS